MGIYNDVMGRVNADNLTAHLLYDASQAEEKKETSVEERVGQAYETLFKQLKEVIPSADPDNDELMDIIVNFARTFEEVYFEVGLAAGFGLYKNMQDKLSRLKEE